MIVDTSALIAIVAREGGWERLIDALEDSVTNALSTMTLLELRIVLSLERFNAADVVDDLLRRYRIATIDFTVLHADAAAEAYRKYGRGRHPARLNFGDCASYATAKLAGEPLLFVGDDFSQTDLTSALA